MIYEVIKSADNPETCVVLKCLGVQNIFEEQMLLD